MILLFIIIHFYSHLKIYFVVQCLRLSRVLTWCIEFCAMLRLRQTAKTYMPFVTRPYRDETILKDLAILYMWLRTFYSI